MKKLTIMFSAIAFAMVSQAASVSWNVMAPGKGAAYKDYKVYICESVTAFKNESEIQSYLLGTSGNSATIISNRGDASAIGTVKGLDDEKSGQTQAFKVVIVDAGSTGYWVTDGAAEIYTTGTTHTDFTLADASTMLAKPMTVFGTSPVPEPTSGLMLMLGIGLMALKRKRA